ncbi:unnamed protein product [Brachionus calyciflorus]|uniref:Rab-like protein 3 n=1 Tax=Brachionus calyciflorus TaxID=104777 RepID=A0A814F0S1_9BILA|nr:unnamed protein product [Brachionus calyciflorus]
MNSNYDKVKIVVVGDSGVGKTSLVHLIAHQEVLKKPNWTIGCSVDVKLHEFKDGTPQHKTCFIEFFDIGGNLGHRSSAKMFLSGADGIILVHDLTNRKSQENLHQWIADVMEQNEKVSVGTSDYHYESKQSPGKKTTSKNSSFFYQDNSNLLPLIFVGTKLDQAQIVRNSNSFRNQSQIALMYRADEINLDCMQPNYLAPATSNSIKLAKFFDKVFENKFAITNLKSNYYSIQTEKPKTNDLFNTNINTNSRIYANKIK